MLDWSCIDTVFLDMDGTLLDLRFDNHFWLEHVPLRYAESRGISLAASKDALYARYQALLGSLQWYCVDHWTQELALDIAMLKAEVEHLIAVHPHVLSFLEALAAAGKRRVLVTNAHQKSIELKMSKTRLDGHLEHIVCSHDLLAAKESPEFWPRVQEVEPFDPQRTLFVDDSLPVLRAARQYGFRWLLAILMPDSAQPVRSCEEFDAIEDFSALLPGLEAMAPAAANAAQGPESVAKSTRGDPRTRPASAGRDRPCPGRRRKGSRTGPLIHGYRDDARLFGAEVALSDEAA